MNKTLRFGFSITLLLLGITLSAQQFERIYDIPVNINNETLYNAWAGGLNSCQFSHLDANMDGKKDLFIFDKTNSRISIYLNMDDTPGSINYKYTADYNHLFPTGIRNWAFMRDMNCDGKEDLLINSGGGFKIHWNTSTSSLSFNSTPTNSIQALYQTQSGSFTANIYSVAQDISAFEDIDNDGDIDAITWTENANSLYLFINMAVENGDCSTYQFVCRGMCYGMLNEAPDSFDIYTGISSSCFQDVINPRSLEEERESNRHVGGTIMVVDLDQNGIKDLVLGDVGNSDLVAVPLTESTIGRDSAMHVIYDFPATYSNTIPVDLKLYPAGYYLDINNDGVKDMVVSSNSYSDSEDRFGIWLYTNNGYDDLPDFEFVQNDFLQEQQIDLGSGAFPVVVDIDNDGKKDLLISNIKYYDGINSLTCRIAYYKNIGTANSPAFEPENDNWLDIPSHNWRGAYPAFGDLDGDGDIDLLLGDQDGTIHFFRNTAAQGQPHEFVLIENSLKNNNGAVIDVGQFSVPQIVDLNNDGLNDLIVGEYNGNINYYENIGTSADFSFQHKKDTLGTVLATNILGIQGKSVPHFFKNNQNQWELIMGTETGQINHYNNIDNNLEGSFNLLTNTFEGIRDGERSSVFLADITGDGLRELFVGNLGGGIGIYRGLVVDIDENKTQQSFNIYPNPASDILTIYSTDLEHETGVITIYDAMGRVVTFEEMRGSTKQMNTHQLPTGLYILNLKSKKINATQRFIVQH